MAQARILVTGGAGYIGSHTCVELISAGYEVVVLDNFSNSKPAALREVKKVAGVLPRLFDVDLRNYSAVLEAMKETRPDAVIHLASLKSVGESMKQPLRYIQNNVNGSVNLFTAMEEVGTRHIVFSSTCAVYGAPDRLPVSESAPIRDNLNTYALTKVVVEEILRKLQKKLGWSISLLRYFNAAGAHPSGVIGEDPSVPPTNLVPNICQIAGGKQQRLTVWGNDYPTRDGTGVRDYLHVCDLAAGHIAALERLKLSAVHAHNLGSGKGYSVLEVLEAFQKASGCEVPYEVRQRRPGDVAEIWADTNLAERDLGWKATRGLEDMCRDAWRWQESGSRPG